MEERHIRVPRTARYHYSGTLEGAPELWVVLHGYGYLARYFLNAFADLDEGRCIVAPEGLSRFYLDGQHARVGATWMTREDRLHEIEDHVNYLDELTAVLKKQARPDAPVSVLGFSQGVATASRWAYLGRTEIQRLVLWGGTMPPEFDPKELGRRWSKIRIDLVHGENDALVGPEAMRKNHAQLVRAGIEAEMHAHDGGHSLDPVVLARLMSS